MRAFSWGTLMIRHIAVNSSKTNQMWGKGCGWEVEIISYLFTSFRMENIYRSWSPGKKYEDAEGLMKKQLWCGENPSASKNCWCRKGLWDSLFSFSSCKGPVFPMFKKKKKTFAYSAQWFQNFSNLFLKTQFSWMWNTFEPETARRLDSTFSDW